MSKLLKNSSKSKKELKRMLSKLGVASRKNSEIIIRSGRVKVNGQVVTNPIQPISPFDKILLDDKPIAEKKIEIYALNKPRGVVTTMSKSESRQTIADLMPKHKYLFPVGRLDKASRGLLLFTNDNDFADFVLSSKSNIEKTYRVQIRGHFDDQYADKMMNGLVIDDVKYCAKNVEIVRINDKTSWIEVVLDEGKNREIRNILKSFGYEVLDLIRIQFGKLKLRELDISSGKYVAITKDMVV